MSMTDPIADLLARIRNAQMARHAVTEVPSSRVKVAIVEILKNEGYIENFQVTDDDRQGVLKIHLKYGPTGDRAITGMERVSRPGRRVYRRRDEIPRVLDGLGITIVSTARGVVTGQTCQKLGVGGEVLCNIW